MPFSYPSYRLLTKYLGEADAMVELTELAVRRFLFDASRSGNPQEFVQEASKQHSVIVNLAEMDCVRRHLARQYVVIVYESAERFLYEFRGEHSDLHGRKWTGDAHDKDALTLSIENVGGDFGQDLVDRFQYYRLVRNWIVHKKSTILEQASKKRRTLADYSPEHLAFFEKTPGPNAPEELEFGDFILFSRILKRLGERMCELGIPAAGRWAALVPLKRFKKLSKNPQRLRNAIAGQLRTQYGIDADSSSEIAGQLADSLAQR